MKSFYTKNLRLLPFKVQFHSRSDAPPSPVSQPGLLLPRASTGTRPSRPVQRDVQKLSPQNKNKDTFSARSAPWMHSPLTHPSIRTTIRNWYGQRGKWEYNLLILSHHGNMPWAKIKKKKKKDLFHLCKVHGTQLRFNSTEENDAKICNY